MLQIAHIAENQDLVIKGLIRRGVSQADRMIDQLLQTDAQRRHTQGELDDLLARSNQISKQIGQLMQQGKKEEAEAAKQQTLALKAQSKNLAEQLRVHEESLQEQLYQLPNVPHPSVPDGRSASDNEVIYEYGALPELGEDALPHWELIEKYDIIDFALGNKISGAGFPVYKGQGARLQRGLINFFLDEARAAGYTEIQPPLLVNEASGYGTGQLPDKEGQMYEVQDGLYLIPTAEVPITNLYRDMLLKQDDLPILNVGHTACFRREAGSWGADVRGLNRLHQFDKVEIVQIRTSEQSYTALEEMALHVRRLLEKLELPHRVLKLCAGDLGFTAALTYDMEVYSAAQQKWLEVSSVSNFETYQSNRLKLRYKDHNSHNRLLHTLNGSALALPRIMAALLENNQESNHVKLPEVLIPYTGFDRIT